MSRFGRMSLVRGEFMVGFGLACFLLSWAVCVISIPGGSGVAFGGRSVSLLPAGGTGEVRWEACSVMDPPSSWGFVLFSFCPDLRLAADLVVFLPGCAGF